MNFVEFDSCLPQFDKYSVQRKQELQEMREEYVLVQKIDGAPHQVKMHDLIKMQTSCKNCRFRLESVYCV